MKFTSSLHLAAAAVALTSLSTIPAVAASDCSSVVSAAHCEEYGRLGQRVSDDKPATKNKSPDNSDDYSQSEETSKAEKRAQKAAKKAAEKAQDRADRRAAQAKKA